MIRILLIDDDIVDRKACQRALAQSAEHDFVLSLAETGRDGLRFACSEQPDCILLDYRLPDLDGLEFLTALRDAIGEIPTPVIMLTGANNAAVAVEAMKLGARDYLVKDLERQYLELLPAVIQRVLGEQRLVREKRKTEEALRQSEARYRSTLDNMLEGCQIIGFDWRYHYLNDAVAAHGKLEKEAALGRAVMEVFPGIERTSLFSTMRRCMDERVPISLENEFTFLDGSKGWFELSMQPVPEGIFILSMDITERKRSEAALQAMRAEMEQLTRFQVASQTVAAIAHELHQPLNAVASYAEAALRLLRAGNPQPDRLLHALESSGRQAQRAGGVARELLEFMKRGESQPERVELNDLVRAVLDRMDADGFQAKVELRPDLAQVSANRLQLEKVLANLIENGVEAMGSAGDGSHIAITVDRSADGGMAQVTVRDGGPGIDGQTLYRIFDPFFTTKPTGLGMGLAISRSIIESHGGQLWAESAPGSGASFHFTLPFAP